MTDPYQALGVSKNATADEIKNAYRGLAKKFHPDLNPGNKKAETQFKEINAAYEILSSPENRAKFDRGEWETQEGQRPGAGAHRGQGPYYRDARGAGGPRYSYDFTGGGFDESIFEDLFGGAARGRRAPPREETYQMEVDLRDAILGAEREIHLPSGKRLSVKIPKNSRPGQKLRFAGQGTGGVDVFVELAMRADPRFKEEGTTLIYELLLPLATAVLGGELAVPTPEGQVVLKIPPNTSTGRRFRIPGKGMFLKGGATRGDLIAVARVTLPESRDTELEAAIRAWSEGRGTKGRSA